MKVCPKCLLPYEDIENFCFNDGTPLDFLSDSNEQATVVLPTVPTQMVNCRSCATENKANAKFCKKCGITLTAVNEPFQVSLNKPGDQQSTVTVQNLGGPNFGGFQPSNQVSGVQPDNSIKFVLGGLALLIGLIFAGVFLYPPNKPNDNTKTNKTPETPASPTPNPNLPSSFERDYTGTTNKGKLINMTLFRDGENLKGTAETDNHIDTLSGTIDENGRFELRGYEDGTRYTGNYSGTIFSDGTITGTWTDGKKNGSYNLAQQQK
jgi:hypothetical protein